MASYRRIGFGGRARAALALAVALTLPPLTPLWASTGVASSAAAPSEAAAGEEASIVDARPDQTRRMSVSVFVNGQGPFRFLVDSGADSTAVSDRLAARLQLQSSGTAILHSISGESSVAMVRIDRLVVSNRSVSGITAATLRQEDIGADGLLGIDSLQGQRMTLDFRSNLMMITAGEKRPQSEARRGDEGEVIVVRGRRYAGQLVLTDAHIGRTRVRVVIDTGAEWSVANLALRRELVRRRAGDPSRIELIGVDGQGLTADVAIVPELAISDLRLRNIPIAFADAHPFRTFRLDDIPAMLLGMDVLSQMDQVSVDFLSRTVRFVLAPRR
jgi:predicted aspartyl protease